MVVNIVKLTDQEANAICRLLQKAKFFRVTFDFSDCREFENYHNILVKRIRESWVGEQITEKERLQELSQLNTVE